MDKRYQGKTGAKWESAHSEGLSQIIPSRSIRRRRCLVTISGFICIWLNDTTSCKSLEALHILLLCVNEKQNGVCPKS